MRKVVRDRILNKCKHRCVQCGSIERLEVDHIIPLACGGLHSEENMQILCKSCNCSKGGRSPMVHIAKFIINDPEKDYILINPAIKNHHFDYMDITKAIQLALENHPQFRALYER